MKAYVCVYINNRIFKAKTWKMLYSERTDYTGNQFYGKASIYFSSDAKNHLSATSLMCTRFEGT